MNGAFSKIEPNLQLVWDSTSLGLLKACPRRYYYSMILARQTEPNFHLTFGIIYHSALELYDRLRAQHHSHTFSQRAAVRHVLEQTWIDGKPWESGDNNKNRATLLRTVIWYLEHFRDVELKTHILPDNKPAVELSFKFHIDFLSATHEDIILSGHLDKIAELSDALYVLDRKTTKNSLGSDYFSHFSPDNQMTLYTIAGEVVAAKPISGLIIDAAQIGVTFTRFQRAHVHRTKSQLQEWLHDLQTLLKQNEQYVEANYWPMNDKACYLCAYKRVCGTAPETRHLQLQLLEHRVWDPTVNRGV